MGALLEGVIAGLIAGIVMGVVSDAGYRLKLLKSSLFVIDGNFLFRFSAAAPSRSLLYLAGIPIHLVTSAVFGGVYGAGTAIAGLNALSWPLVGIYFFILWLSMLCIALPVAGQGLAGRKAHPVTWLEQLILHAVFAVGYYRALQALIAA